MNKFKNGLFVGKFVAYHKGHQSCINHFASLCKRLKVVICTKPSDRIPGEIRKSWLEKDLKFNVNKDINFPENIDLYHLVEDNIPLYPEGLIQWCNAIKDLVGSDIDIMFGNEDYVLDCAKVFKSEYYIPDMNRTDINISSTKILDTGLKNYHLLSKVAQPYFNKTILISGALNTGKSQLCKNLASDLKGHYIEEFGRDFFENEILKCGLNGLNDWSIKEYENAAFYHHDIIEEYRKKPIKLLFLDVDALLTESFAQLYIRENSSILRELIMKQKKLINERIFLSNYNIPEESIQKKDYFDVSCSKRKQLIDQNLLNLYLKHSFNFYGLPVREFGFPEEEGFTGREDNVKKYLEEKYLI